MKFSKPLLLAAGLGMAGAPVAAQQADPFQDLFNNLQRISAHYQILLARSFVDLTYESLSVEPGTGNLVLSDVVIYPEFPWDTEFACEITLDRAVTGSAISFETLGSTIEISGLTVPAACFEPEVGGMLPMFGYENGIVAEAATIDITYDLPSSAADVTLQAAVEDAVDLQVTAGFNYLWFRFPMDGGDEPEPVAFLGSVEVSVENRGLWERVEPMIAQQVGDPAQLPQMVQGMLGPMLGGSPESQAFAENLSVELGRFIQEKNRIVVTAAPDGGIYLGPDTFSSPDDVIALLEPVVSGAPMSYRALIQPDVLNAALSGGNGLSDEDKLSAGRALMTGVGAPRSIGDALALLRPMADAWNGEAAVLIADALVQTGPAPEAYAAALVGMAGGESRAIGIGDIAEGNLDVAEIIAIQDEVGNAWPDGAGMESALQAAIAEGDISALRQMAHAAAVGRGMPRSYAAAYFFATLAAAAGDKGASNLRTRLDRRFGADPAWRAEADEASSIALQVWTGGLAATIAARVQ